MQIVIRYSKTVLTSRNEYPLLQIQKTATSRIMKELKSEQSEGHKPASGSLTLDPAQNNKFKGGFAKVIAGGRIVRPDPTQSELVRMVTGSSNAYQDTGNSKTAHAIAVLESVTANLEAGIGLVDEQETALAKIGGKLSEIALVLNQTRSPRSTDTDRVKSQSKFEVSRNQIRTISKETFDQTALFSIGPAKPVTIAVPTMNSWEGVSIDRVDLATPGLQTVDKGKVFGDGPGFFLDAGSIKKAFNEWRTLCIHNRLQWGLLVERLHGVTRSFEKFRKDRKWHVPSFSTKPQFGPLKRPNRNN